MIIRTIYYFLILSVVITILYYFAAIESLLLLILLYFIMLICAIILSIFVEKVGSKAGSFLSLSGRPDFRPGEVFAGDIERARHSKRSGQFDEALAIIDDVIKNAGELSSALFLKAQIQWEGFGNAAGAKRCLRKVMQIEAAESTLHTWASNLYNDIVRAVKEQYQEVPHK